MATKSKAGTLFRSTRAMVGALTAAFYVLPPVAHADHISTGKDVARLRPMMDMEGFLNFVHPGGEERTGWTDVRHAANDGSTFVDPRTGTALNTLIDNNLGYDWSDNTVKVDNKVLTIDTNQPAGPDGAIPKETANPSIARDYDFANEIYAQAGITIVNDGVRSVDFSTGNAAGNTVVTPPIGVADRDNIQANDREADPVINNWYGTTGISATGGALRGVTRAAGATSGTMVFDGAANDTLAHEIGHFLLGPNDFAAPDGPAHSNTDTDLMAQGSDRTLPTNATKGSGNSAPRDPGRMNGPLGTVDHFDEAVMLNGANIQQIQAIHAHASVITDDNGNAHGDRADFDWVEDNIFLEPTNVSNADFHPGAAPSPADFLVWEIALINDSDHEHRRADGNILHDHDDWGALDLDAFAEQPEHDFFRTIDIVSQIARYSDMDVRNNAWSMRDSALDFGAEDLVPEFSINGVDWMPGILINVFLPGWTAASLVDDFVSRWRSPMDATLVRLKALTSNGHDGNTQIDAIIASRAMPGSIPEPGTLMLLAVGGAMLGYRRGGLPAVSA